MNSANSREFPEITDSLILNEKVIPYLYSIGCKYLKVDTPTLIGNTEITADVVAYLDEGKSKPYIVAEVKSRLPDELTLFDPSVQHVFTTAVALGASVRYLLVTDGKKHSWFERSADGHSLIQLDDSPELFQEATQLELFESKLIPITDPEQFLELMQAVMQILANAGVVFGLRMAIEINRILLVKLKDEEHLYNGGESLFTSNTDKISLIGYNFRHLYEEATASLDNAPTKEISGDFWLFSSQDQLLLSIVRILEPYALSTVTPSILGNFFWTAFADYYSKIERGFYFTPIGLGELLVHLLKPSPGMHIIDPACGSGLFLVMAKRYIDNQRFLMQTRSEEKIVGLEWNAEVAELAATNLALNSMAPSQILHIDALDYRVLAFHGINTQTYDRVILDPPIGDTFEDEDVLRQYEVSRWVTKPTKELLFIELALNLLRPGGLLIILVPDSLLSAPVYERARSWLLTRSVFKAIISLPNEAFAPVGHSGKASILLLENNTPGDRNNDNVLVAEVKRIGYDKSGKATSQSDLFYLSAIIDTFLQTGLINNGQIADRLLAWTVTIQELKSTRLDTIQLNPQSERLLNEIRNNQYATVQIQDVVNIISGQNFKQGEYVEREQQTAVVLQAGAVRDLALDLSNAPFITSQAYEAAKRCQVKVGDILVTTTGQYLGRAVAIDNLPMPAVASGAVTILRPKPDAQIDSFFLATVISSELGKQQIEQKKAATIAQPYIRRSDLGSVMIPLPDLIKQREIAQRLKSMITTVERLHKLAQQLETATKRIVIAELLQGGSNA